MPGSRVPLVAQAGAAGLVRDGRGILLRALLPPFPQGSSSGAVPDEMGVPKKEDSAHRSDAGATRNVPDELGSSRTCIRSRPTLFSRLKKEMQDSSGAQVDTAASCTNARVCIPTP